MPVLPDKFSLRGTAVPDGARPIANISYDSPLYAAGEKFGNAITGLGQKLREPQPSEGAKALSASATAIKTAQEDYEKSPDPAQGGINGADYLQQTRARIKDQLSPEALAQYGSRIDAMFESGTASLGQRVQARQLDARIGEVTALFPQLSAQHAALTDPTARQEIASSLFGAIDKLHSDGAIDEKRALEMKRGLQLQLVEADVKAQPAAWRIEMLQEREGDEAAQSYFRRTLGAEKADLLLQQALGQNKAEHDQTVVDKLLQAGTGEDERGKALAIIREHHGNDAGLQRRYEAQLEGRRFAERRDQTRAAHNAFVLTLGGQADQITEADRSLLMKSGQWNAVSEAAQLAKAAPGKGEPLFKEKYLAMSEAEQARYAPADLVRKLSPEDFVEVSQAKLQQGPGGDPLLRSRMQGFVEVVGKMLPSVTLGTLATKQQRARDASLLAIVHDEVRAQVADAEKDKGRKLTTTEYQQTVDAAAGAALLMHMRMEGEWGGNDVASKGRNAETYYQSAAMLPAERMAQDDAYADLVYGAARARGERVQTIDPAFTGGSRDPQTAIEEKKLERHLRRQADLEAERRKFGEAIRDDELGFYIGPDKTKNTFNDLRFDRLGYDGMAANEVEKWWRTRESSGAIDRLREIDSNRARVQAVAAKMERGEKLNQQEDYIRQGMHLWPQHLARKTKEALGDLATAEARRAQIPQSPALRKLNEAETVGDALKVLINNPLEILAVKAGQAVPKTVAGAAATLLTGPYGGVLASAYVVFGSEYAGAVLKGFEDEGIDLQNENAVLEAIKKKDLMERIYGKAFVVAGIASMAEVASGMVGTIKLTSVPSKTWGGIVEKAAQTGVKAGIGVAEKAGTGIVTGEKPTAGGKVESGVDGAMDLLIPDIQRLAF